MRVKEERGCKVTKKILISTLSRFISFSVHFDEPSSL